MRDYERVSTAQYHHQHHGTFRMYRVFHSRVTENKRIHTVGVLFVLYVNEWRQMKEQIMKFLFMHCIQFKHLLCNAHSPFS